MGLAVPLECSEVFGIEKWATNSAESSLKKNVGTTRSGTKPNTSCASHKCQHQRSSKASKATGPDNIPGRLMKEAAEELAPGLANLFQISIDNGKIPSDWKSALVTPVF